MWAGVHHAQSAVWKQPHSHAVDGVSWTASAFYDERKVKEIHVAKLLTSMFSS